MKKLRLLILFLPIINTALINSANASILKNSSSSDASSFQQDNSQSAASILSNHSHSLEQQHLSGNKIPPFSPGPVNPDKKVDPSTYKASKRYINDRLNYEAKMRKQGDKSTLQNAQNYTDTQIQQETTLVHEHDKQLLDSSKDYINQQVGYENNRINNLSSQVDTNARRAYAGIAGAMAMATLPSVEGSQYSFGMAMGTYHDEGAIALGIKSKINNNNVLSINGELDTQNNLGAAVGIGIGF